MHCINIPGFGCLELNHLIMDYNGTLAIDGRLAVGVGERLVDLSRRIKLHIVTADTHGTVKQMVGGMPCQIHVLPPQNQAEAKLEYLNGLGANQTVAMGNGRNDRLMLKAAALGIGVVLGEGAFVPSLMDADIICISILDALDLLRFPMRLIASLRS